MTESILPPIHPGEILREEFLVPLNMSAANLAVRLGVPHEQIEAIVAEQAPITSNITVPIYPATRLRGAFRAVPERRATLRAVLPIHSGHAPRAQQIVPWRARSATPSRGRPISGARVP